MRCKHDRDLETIFTEGDILSYTYIVLWSHITNISILMSIETIFQLGNSVMLNKRLQKSPENICAFYTSLKSVQGAYIS